MIRVERDDDDQDSVKLAMIDPELGPEAEVDSFTITVEYIPDAARVIVEARPGSGCTLELVVRTPD